MTGDPSIPHQVIRRVRRRRNRSGLPGGPPQHMDFALGVPFGYTPDLRDSPRIGAVVHMFHPDLAGEFAGLLGNLGPEAAIMLTTDTVAKREAILDAFENHRPDLVEVRLVENRGRDMAAFLTAFPDRFSEFDLLVFLHSKLTDYSPHGRGWREGLLAGLVGSESVVRSVRAIFEAEPRTGLVFCQHHEAIRKWTGWEGNFGTARRLAGTWGLHLSRRAALDFPSGGMFWIRPAALRPMLELGLRTADFPPESGHRDGTVGHAVERLFALAAEYAGFYWFKVAAPEFHEYRDTIVIPNSEVELRAFLNRHRRRLLLSKRRPQGRRRAPNRTSPAHRRTGR